MVQDRLVGLFRDHFSTAVRCAHRIIQDADDAEDVAAEALLKMASSTSLQTDDQHLKAAFLRTTYNLARNWKRDTLNRRRILKAHRARPVEVTSGRASLTEPALRQALRNAVIQLPQMQRRVFVLCDLEGLSYKEVSDQLGIAAQTSANHLTRARRAVREDLLKSVARLVSGYWRV